MYLFMNGCNEGCTYTFCAPAGPTGPTGGV